MPRQTASTVVPYSARQMYDLVVDMDSYPAFLPWIVKARKYQEEDNQFLSEMTFSFKGIRETFHTVDRLVPGESIHISLLKGPFHHFENEWHFTPLPEGCRVDFSVDFRFNSKLLDLTLGPFFSSMTQKMVSSFRTRADQVYGSMKG
ncbi:MAG: type II toxin-antitoxin system RatA family toxin [Magnetococcales bacterium]|nr:type II toxin-antitoxin system RatA family toxin [Magnetococcales bacterium]